MASESVRLLASRGFKLVKWDNLQGCSKCVARSSAIFWTSVFFQTSRLDLELIPPYSPSQGGAWESLIKVFKRTLTNTVNLIHCKPTLVELQTYTLNSTRLVNDRHLTAQSDDPLHYNAISLSSLLTPSLDPVLLIGKVHNRDHLRCDYRYNCSLAQQFWEHWVKFYLPQLQRRKKCFKLTPNLQVGHMVSVGGCVTSNFTANRRVPKFSLNNCAQSFKNTFMCPKLRTNPVLKYTKCHISTNLSNFLKVCLQKIICPCSNKSPIC